MIHQIQGIKSVAEYTPVVKARRQCWNGVFSYTHVLFNNNEVFGTIPAFRNSIPVSQVVVFDIDVFGAGCVLLQGLLRQGVDVRVAAEYSGHDNNCIRC